MSRNYKSTIVEKTTRQQWVQYATARSNGERVTGRRTSINKRSCLFGERFRSYSRLRVSAIQSKDLWSERIIILFTGSSVRPAPARDLFGEQTRFLKLRISIFTIRKTKLYDVIVLSCRHRVFRLKCKIWIAWTLWVLHSRASAS